MSLGAAPSISDRLWAAFRALVRAELAEIRFLGVYEYSVQAADTSTVDIDPTDTTLGLPTLGKVPLRPSILGEVVEPDTGGRCLVMFVNGDPARPVVISIEGSPKLAKIGDGAQFAARMGDTAGIYPIVTTQTKVKI